MAIDWDRIDQERIDAAVLALLHLGLHDGDYAWKGFERSALDRLHARGFIADRGAKTNSVRLSHEGLARAEALFQELFRRTTGCLVDLANASTPSSDLVESSRDAGPTLQ